MSRGNRDQYERRYHVTDTRTHPKGYTEYKVKAEFISKKDPQDVKEVVVWKRYSDFKKLHGELLYTHRNLFQRTQEFPPFPRAQVFGRFEAPVIEERRQASETMLNFTVHIPALNNSPQLKDFFRHPDSLLLRCHPGGDVTVQSDITHSADALALPPPLTPEPVRSSSFEFNEDVSNVLEDTMTGNVTEQPEDTVGDEPSPFDLLFDVTDEQTLTENGEGVQTMSTAASQHPLTSNDLAMFDPCFTEDKEPNSEESGTDLNLLSLGCEGGELDPARTFDIEERGAYVSLATVDVQRAMEKESSGDYPEALRLYRNAVDTLLSGVKDDPCTARRDAVARRTSEYLRHAENIFQQHMKASTD
ncbi:sorting nexin-15 isoform X2 [Pelobates fuscus]|uniref:sorting nexin-15 isoform X2 n=1 Tax=Pelobates fuscus TaxID=191477 RepID=UPI002FE42CB8